jgi:hypothetical protein
MQSYPVLQLQPEVRGADEGYEGYLAALHLVELCILTMEEGTRQDAELPALSASKLEVRHWAGQ